MHNSTTIAAMFSGLSVQSRVVALIMPLLLTGCASQSAQTAATLDKDHPAYRSAECRDARAQAWVHQDLKLARLVASPAVVWWGGPITAIPVLLTNVGLSLADKQDASDMAGRCGGVPSGQLEIAAGTAAEAALGVAASGAGSLVAKTVPVK
jgi:uncharacterized protein YceK